MLAARPFTRYSIHLSVCGPFFNLAIIDRSDRVVTKSYNINKDLKLCVIQRLGRELDTYRLRPYPTVVPVHTHSHFKPFILKNAWPTCGRLAESTVYIWSTTKELTSHLTELDGMAQVAKGGNTFDAQQPNEVVKVSSHRIVFKGQWTRAAILRFTALALPGTSTGCTSCDFLSTYVCS